MHTTKMRLLLAAIVALVVLIPTSAGGQSDPPQQISPTASPTPAQPIDHRCPRGMSSVKSYKQYVQRVLLRRVVSRIAQRKIEYMAKCQRSKWAKKMVRRYWKRFKEERKYRIMEQSCTPFGEYAIPPHIVMRESHGTNVPNSQGSDASGYYQILNSTWLGAGGPDIKPRPRYLAMSFPKAIQDCVAHRLWNGGNNNHWALTR